MRKKSPLFEENGKHLISPMSRCWFIQVNSNRANPSPPPPAHLSGSDMVQKGILKAEQGGFRKMHGTVDHLHIKNAN